MDAEFRRCKDHFVIERCALEIAVAAKVFFGANGGGVRCYGTFPRFNGLYGLVAVQWFCVKKTLPAITLSSRSR